MDWLRRLFGGAGSPTPGPAIAVNDRSPHLMEDLRRQVENDVAAGFASREEVIRFAVDMLQDEGDPGMLRAEAEVVADAALAAHAAAQAQWPDQTDCDRVDAAFAALEAEGVIARQNFSCCGTCGASEIWDEIEAARSEGRPAHGYAFYHWQDTEGAVEGQGLYLNYGSCEETPEAAVAVGHIIVSRLLDHGLRPEWDGRIERRIGVPLDWKRRRPELAG